MNTRLSHSVGPTERALLEMTIGDNFDRTAARFPEREAVVDVPTGRRWTYAGLRADVDALASACSKRGSSPGTGLRSGPRTVLNGCWCSSPRRRWVPSW